MITKTELGINLLVARKQKGLKQNETAKLAGISPQRLSYFECGRQYPTLENIVALADVLGCSVDRLLNR